MTLAERLDKFMKDYDFYDYQDNDGSVEEAKKILKESPETVISNLLDILEEKETPDMTKVIENVIEITLVYNSLMCSGEIDDDVDSLVYKQSIYEYAREFEKENKGVEFNGGERDYYIEIEEFAKKKLLGDFEIEDDEKLNWMKSIYGEYFISQIANNPMAIRHYYKAIHDYDMGVTDADDYAWLNTLFQYDIGGVNAMYLIRWFYVSENTTVQDRINVGSKEELKDLCGNIGLHLDFSNWVNEEPKALRFEF